MNVPCGSSENSAAIFSASSVRRAAAYASVSSPPSAARGPTLTCAVVGGLGERDRDVGPAGLHLGETRQQHAVGVADGVAVAGELVGERELRDRRLTLAALDEHRAADHVRDRAHPGVGEVRGLRVELREHLVGLAEAAERRECACGGRDRLHHAPMVAHLGEHRDRGAGPLDALLGVAAPDRDVGEQHLHHSLGPTATGLARLDHDLVREPFRFVELALVETHEREHAERPADAAPVADLAEQVGRLQQPLLGVGVRAVEERDHREVLLGPRLAATITGRDERRERVGYEALCFLEPTLEEPDHPEAAQRVGHTRLVAERTEQGDGPAVVLLGRVVVRGVGFDPAERDVGVTLPARRAECLGFLEHDERVVARFVEEAERVACSGPPEQRLPAQLARVGVHEAERALPEAAGGDEVLALFRSARGLGELGERAFARCRRHRPRPGRPRRSSRPRTRGGARSGRRDSRRCRRAVTRAPRGGAPAHPS